MPAMKVPDSVRIRRADHTDPSIAGAIHAVQIDAYAQEAALLGATHFPPLSRTVDDIRTSRETFFAAYRRDQMVGAISIQADPTRQRQQICSLVVAPECQRQGIARQLLAELLRLHAADIVTVHTGVRNAPALALYGQFDFVAGRRWHVGPDHLELVELQRTPR
jgi:ribosomal protein S18 acetylase RimI-like enzyme